MQRVTDTACILVWSCPCWAACCEGIGALPVWWCPFTHSICMRTFLYLPMLSCVSFRHWGTAFSMAAMTSGRTPWRASTALEERKHTIVCVFSFSRWVCMCVYVPTCHALLYSTLTMPFLSQAATSSMRASSYQTCLNVACMVCVCLLCFKYPLCTFVFMWT
jgi:hypothetical protein